MEDLFKLSLVEIEQDNAKEINGGVLGLDDFIIGVAVGATLAIINDWDNLERGFTGRPYQK